MADIEINSETVYD